MTIPDLYQKVLSVSSATDSMIHGPQHWRRVARNANCLADIMEISPDIGLYFAVFHDALRENDDIDPEHGRRGAELALSMRDFVTLDDADFSKLYFACCHHTGQMHHDDPAIGACWDADRLDIGRVGFELNVKYFTTEAAKKIVTGGDFRMLEKYESRF